VSGVAAVAVVIDRVGERLEGAGFTASGTEQSAVVSQQSPLHTVHPSPSGSATSSTTPLQSSSVLLAAHLGQRRELARAGTQAPVGVAGPRAPWQGPTLRSRGVPE